MNKSDNEISNPEQSKDKYSLISNNMSKEKKNQLKNNYIDFLRKNYPHINTVETYFTDAIFIANNKDSLKLDIVDILKNDRDFSIYRNRLKVHFVDKKGWDLKKASNHSEDYIRKLALLREFIEGKNN